MNDFFVELALVVILATFLGFVFNKLRQPIILAYIITGIVLGSSFLGALTFHELLNVFSDLGIAFLLFVVGISLDLKIFKDIGKTSMVTGVGQIIVTSIVGFGISSFLGFSLIESLYISIALTFSSTIIVVKLLSDKKEINSLYGKISLGFLLVQDFVAIIALLLISTLGFSGDFSSQALSFLASFVVLFSLFFIARGLVVGKIFSWLSDNQELLFLGALAWCFAFTSAGVFLGFSKEIGAFLAGVAIASLPYSYAIVNKMKPLRDFFIVLFFVVLGSNLVFASPDIVLVPALIFSVFVLVGNPVIVFVLMHFLGYKGRTSFLSSLTVAQISEFSLILVFLGQSVGHLSQGVVSVITLVAVLTIGASTYLILHGNRLYDLLASHLPILKTPRFFEDSLHMAEGKKFSAVCIGFGRVGSRVFRNQENKSELLVIDFNPAVVKRAAKEGFHAWYGDALDIETIDSILSVKPSVIISTISDLELNMNLAKRVSEKKNSAILIVVSEDSEKARALKSQGVRFIVNPYVISAGKIGVLLGDIKNGNNFELNWLEEQDS